jgi:hypothetical protein
MAMRSYKPDHRVRLATKVTRAIRVTKVILVSRVQKVTKATRVTEESLVVLARRVIPELLVGLVLQVTAGNVALLGLMVGLLFLRLSLTASGLYIK